MSDKIFRKKALEHLQSPDDIDQVMRLADRKGWIALFAILVCLCFGVVWSWFGRIPVKVNAAGLVIREGGLKGVVALGEGQVEAVLVTLGQDVRRGQVIARIRRPDILIKLRNARMTLNNASQIHRQLEIFLRKNLNIHDALSKQKSDALKELSDKLLAQEEFLNNHLNSMEKLSKGKIITPIKVQEVRSNLLETVNRINNTRVELSDALREKFRTRTDAELEILKSAELVAEDQRKVAEIIQQLEINTSVIAPFKGRVVEIRSKPGNIVGAGHVIAMLEDPEEKKSAVLFLDGAEGKKVRPGMTARIFPSTVKREEFGGVLGVVTRVSPYSISPEALVELLGNQTMADQFIKQANGAPIIAFIDLVPSPNTPSGYRWTSSEGPASTIETGTITDGEIIVEKRRPLSLVLPIIKHIFGT